MEIYKYYTILIKKRMDQILTNNHKNNQIPCQVEYETLYKFV